MAPRETWKVTLLRKSHALNSAAKEIGLKVDAFVLYGIFLSLDPKKTQRFHLNQGFQLFVGTIEAELSEISRVLQDPLYLTCIRMKGT